DVIPGLARERAQQEAKREREEAARAAEDAELAAEIEHERRVLAALNEEMKEVNAEMARRRRRLADEAKYSPSQPRMPAGNPRGGQWTDRSGGSSGQSPSPGIAQPMGNVDVGAGSSETEGLFNIGAGGSGTDSANSSDRVLKVAADESGRKYSVNLWEEEVRGHTLREHAGKSDLELEAEFKRRGYDTPYVSFVPRILGSFESAESANDLVNRTLEQNKATVDLVASGKLQDAFVTARFGSVTGREIYRPDPSSNYYYFRNTYGVGVDIRYDPSRTRGYRVHTAYPRND
ncbi:MAG TPA: RNase A-like domain-containing protein, partial [Bradyrhizobium sp.]|nr:RNase A-like domain-containing protein [Bradyrhizobium sp.]